MPFIVISIAVAFLPLNYFSFRVWEALSVCRGYFLSGPFYPLQIVVMTEEGDMGHGTPNAIKQNVYWETDRHGYRKTDSNDHLDIVIIGDSTIAGSSLTQEDIISEVLQRKLQRSVYPYAPSDINNFIHDTRFTINPPRVVILGGIEREIFAYKRLQITPKVRRTIKSKMNSLINSKGYSIRGAIVLDRILKCELLSYLRAQIEPTTIGVRYRGMFFYQGPAAVTSAQDSEILNTIQIIREYNDFFKHNNILFIYMPIPNKETIYYDFLPTRPKVSIINQVLTGLRHTGIPTIDLLSAFGAYRQDTGNPFQIDDTHWNATGVKIAAELIADKIHNSE